MLKHFRTQVQDKSDIEIQLEKSELHLEELIEFGNELVNNIKCANEQQELLQSQEKNKKDIGKKKPKIKINLQLISNLLMFNFRT